MPEHFPKCPEQHRNNHSFKIKAFWLFLCGKHVRAIPGSWHWTRTERHTQVEALHRDRLRESRQTQSASSGKSNVTDFTKRHAKHTIYTDFIKCIPAEEVTTGPWSCPDLLCESTCNFLPFQVWLDDHRHWPIIARLFSLLIELVLIDKMTCSDYCSSSCVLRSVMLLVRERGSRPSSSSSSSSRKWFVPSTSLNCKRNWTLQLLVLWKSILPPAFKKTTTNVAARCPVL